MTSPVTGSVPTGTSSSTVRSACWLLEAESEKLRLGKIPARAAVTLVPAICIRRSALRNVELSRKAMATASSNVNGRPFWAKAEPVKISTAVPKLKSILIRFTFASFCDKDWFQLKYRFQGDGYNHVNRPQRKDRGHGFASRKFVSGGETKAYYYHPPNPKQVDLTKQVVKESVLAIRREQGAQARGTFHHLALHHDRYGDERAQYAYHAAPTCCGEQGGIFCFSSQNDVAGQHQHAGDEEIHQRREDKREKRCGIGHHLLHR